MRIGGDYMAISPVLLNGTIQQTDSVLHNQVKQIEKGMVDQGNIQAQEVKKEQQKATQVVQTENAMFMEERYDAKEKGHNSYEGDGGRQRKKSKKDGKVVKKPTAGRFDMKI